MSMSARRSITVSGDLGSGKTTISVELAERLGLPRVSIGDLHRELARSRGMTALQLNRSSERDEEIDDFLDRRQRELAESGETIIVDSRLGWHFLPGAFKVHLITDPTVAAERVLTRPGDGVESYTSLAEAEQRLRERSESEQARFKIKYGVDKSRLRNYSLVCDTTRTTPHEAVDLIVDAYERYMRRVDDSRSEDDTCNGMQDSPGRQSRSDCLDQTDRLDQTNSPDQSDCPDQADDLTRRRGGDRERSLNEPLLLIDPSRVFPTRSLSATRSGGLSETDAEPDTSLKPTPSLEPELVEIGHTNRLFFIIGAESHRRVSVALRVGDHLVRGRLVAEFEEEVTVGSSATAYFEQRARPEILRAWEIEHGIILPVLPHLAGHSRESPSAESLQNDGDWR